MSSLQRPNDIHAELSNENNILDTLSWPFTVFRVLMISRMPLNPDHPDYGEQREFRQQIGTYWYLATGRFQKAWG